ncbi:MAG: response regulator [Desulfonatronovibrio sp.]
MESTSGKGTSAHPISSVNESADLRHDLEKAPSLRIMLAEDDPTNQFAVSKMLEIAGHEVIVAGNGQEAVKVLKENEKRIDGLLMDIQMPVMGGIEAAKVIRHSLKNKDIPIIALTAHTMAGDREKFLEAGMNDYLSKPLEFEDLKKVIEKHF